MPSSALSPGADLAALDLAAASRGDTAAFARVVDRARATVTSIALAIVRDVARSEEVAQEVLVAVWRGLPRLRNPHSFWPWLRQLTRNRARQHLRSRARDRARPRAGDDELLARAVDEAAPIDERLAGAERAREEAAALAAALAALPDEARELVVLYYREGQSIAQVAGLLGINEAAAKKRLQRARDELRAGVLARLGELCRASAPGAAFTAAVLSAITTAAPGTAAAAGLGVAAKLAAGGKWLPALGAALPGFLLGAAGIVLPLRGLIKRAHDARERRELSLLAVLALLATALFSAAITAAVATRQAGFLITGWAVLQLSFIALYGVWLPRIVARRQAAEVARDPAAARRHRRERAWSLFGLVIGSLAAAGGVLSALRSLG